MTDTAARYRRLAATLTGRIESVPADRWESPSPCEGWTARDVLRHLIEWHHGMAGFVQLTLPDGPSVDDDPVAAWTHTRDAMQEILDDPDRADLEYDGLFGRTSLARTVDGYLGLDLVIHGWDIARATGIDDTIPARDVDEVWAQVETMGDNLRRPGVCGPEVPVPDDADPQTRLLGLLGRKA